MQWWLYDTQEVGNITQNPVKRERIYDILSQYKINKKQKCV